jgi:hypothetical protein
MEGRKDRAPPAGKSKVEITHHHFFSEGGSFCLMVPGYVFVTNRAIRPRRRAYTFALRCERLVTALDATAEVLRAFTRTTWAATALLGAVLALAYLIGHH